MEYKLNKQNAKEEDKMDKNRKVVRKKNSKKKTKEKPGPTLIKTFKNRD